MPKGGDKLFDSAMRTFYSCSEGAYSKVTSTEAGDGQITLTGDEKRIVIDHFGAKALGKFRGNKAQLAAKKLDARRAFRIFPTGKIVNPRVNYPKATGSELRLYFSDDSFKVKSSYYWGVFKRDDELWLCSFGPGALKAASKPEIGKKTRLEILEDDADDDSYQQAVNEPKQMTKSTKSWKRDPKMGSKAIARAKYKCEFFPSARTFDSRSSGKPFMEAHHIVPLGLQSAFSNPNQGLDALDNISCVNPWTHRLIHHGKLEEFSKQLANLLKTRGSLLKRLGLTPNDVIGFYDR